MSREQDILDFESWQRETYMSIEADEIAWYEGWLTADEYCEMVAAQHHTERHAENTWLTIAEYDEESQYQMMLDDMRGYR